MGHLHLRKSIKKQTEYIEKKVIKHNHDFKEHWILEITNLAGEISYYNVHKCSKCGSFKSIREEGNVSGAILRPLNKREAKLAIITADYYKKILIPDFADLKNIKYCKPDKKKKEI